MRVVQVGPSPRPSPRFAGRGRWLVVLLTGCLDIVQHGTPVELAINLLDCDRSSVVAGATELRFTARAGSNVVHTSTTPIDQVPRTISIAPNTDLVLQVDAINAEGTLVARGSSLHFASPSETPVRIELHRAGQFTKSCHPLLTPRAFHSATILSDGRVLVVGGEDSTGSALSSMEIVSASEIRDVGPLAIATPAGALRLPRARHAAALIRNGQVLISGGEADQAISSSALLVDPAAQFGTGAFGPVTLARSRHVALEANGGVFLLGGVAPSSPAPVANPVVERLDLQTFRFETFSSLAVPRLEAALGRVGSIAIIAGGLDGASLSNRVELVSLEVSGLTQHLALATPRRGGQFVTHEGRALLVGGFDDTGVPLVSTERINVVPPGASVVAGPTVTARGDLCAVALSQDRTLLFGSASRPEVLHADGSLESLSFTGSAVTGQSCTLTEDASALIIGGLDASGRAVDEVWRFVPAE